jgi:hypothetical protein
MADGDGKFKRAGHSGSGLLLCLPSLSRLDLLSESSGEDDPEKLVLRRGSSMPVIKQDETASNLILEQQQQQQLLQQQPTEPSLVTSSFDSSHSPPPLTPPSLLLFSVDSPTILTPQGRGRRNTSFVPGHEIKSCQPLNSSISRGVCLETIISRAPSKAYQSESYPAGGGLGDASSDPLEMSMSSLVHEKGDDFPYPSLSSFYFDRKISDSGLDSDLEMGSKSSVSSRGRSSRLLTTTISHDSAPPPAPCPVLLCPDL